MHRDQTNSSNQKEIGLQVCDAMRIQLSGPANSPNPKAFLHTQTSVFISVLGAEMGHLFLPTLLPSESESPWGGAV